MSAGKSFNVSNEYFSLDIIEHCTHEVHDVIVYVARVSGLFLIMSIIILSL